MTTDPWLNNKEKSEIDLSKLEFEDNFINNKSIEIARGNTLPDSKQYLESLERKLKKIKSDPNILEQLARKREDCLNNLINNSFDLTTNLELDAPIVGDSAVRDIYRHLCPVQPLTVGETSHIVKYDQLEEEQDSEPEKAFEGSSETASR